MLYGNAWICYNILDMIADIHITEKSFGPKSLMTNVKFSIDDGEKVGVIGRNGVGKTTLFGILSGDDTDFTGEITFRKGSIIAKTAQEHDGVGDQTVIEYILAGLPDYAKLDKIIREYPETMGENLRKITEYTDALQRFDDLGYYQIAEKVERELANFQLSGRGNEKFANLSGGQKRLAEIVKIMHSGAHLALIDEPTNHMDFVAKQQFIDWISQAREAVLVITHDRDVLRNVDRIVELKDGGAVSYPGNYDAYLAQNAHHTSTDMNDYENVQRQIENLKKRIQYARSKKASWGGTADKKNPFVVMEDRAKKELAELAKIDRPSFWIDRDSAAELDHKSAARYEKFKARNIRMHGINTGESRSKRVLVAAKDLSLGYNSPLFANVNFELRENEAIELRGRNGAGKTTLIKAILARHSGLDPESMRLPSSALSSVASSSAQTASRRESEASRAADVFAKDKTTDAILQFFAGDLTIDKHMKIGVYEQEISTKYFDLPLASAIERLYLDRKLPILQQKIMQLMSDYLFDPIGDAGIKLSQLSGGQKARFQLIAMLCENPQLLILDEPTNHLDLPSIEELETALAKYSGAILYVSHDGYFRDKLGGDVIEIGAK